MKDVLNKIGEETARDSVPPSSFVIESRNDALCTTFFNHVALSTLASAFHFLPELSLKTEKKGKKKKRKRKPEEKMLRLRKACVLGRRWASTIGGYVLWSFIHRLLSMQLPEQPLAVSLCLLASVPHPPLVEGTLNPFGVCGKTTAFSTRAGAF